jgi:hypothetical protein
MNFLHHARDFRVLSLREGSGQMPCTYLKELHLTAVYMSGLLFPFFPIPTGYIQQLLTQRTVFSIKAREELDHKS